MQTETEKVGAKTPLEFPALTSRQLSEATYDLDYLVDGVLVAGQPGIIAGPKKALKTNLCVDLALSLGHGGRFLRQFNVGRAVRVGVMSGESGAGVIQETARRVGLSKNWTLDNFDNVVWSFDIPLLARLDHREALRRFATDCELEVLILDPTYLMLAGIGSDASNLFIVGEYLRQIGTLAQDLGVTVLLVHHTKKGVVNPFEPPELEDIAWAGFQEFARQWILVGRRVKYNPDNGGSHHLWLSYGGSAGHSGLWGLDIEEGTRQDPGGRRWEVEVISAAQARAQAVDSNEEQKQQKAQRQREQDIVDIESAMQGLTQGDTQTAIREASGVTPRRFGVIFHQLQQSGRIHECGEVQKSNGQKYPAFSLTGSHPSGTDGNG